MKTRHWIVVGAVAVAPAVLSLFVGRRAKEPNERAARVAAASAPAPAPYRERSFHAPAPVAAAASARPPIEHEPAPVIAGVVQIGARRRGPAAQPTAAVERQSGVAWASSYSIAVCECQTRSCVAELQGRFLRSMGSIEYDEARDAVAYRASMDHALDCYFALPEGT